MAWSKNGTFQGCDVVIIYSDTFACYYFRVIKGADAYESIWDHKTYETEEECIKACEKHIREVFK